MARWPWALLAITGCASAAGPVGHAEVAAALDDGGAVVLWRADDKGADRVVRLDANGKRTWDRKLDGIPRTTPPIVFGDQVLVRHHHVDRYGVGWQAVAAFALDDGTPRWDTDLDRYDGARGPNGTPVAPAYLDANVVGDRVWVWFGDVKGEQVGAAILDPQGRLVTSEAAHVDEPGAPVVIGGRVIVHGSGEGGCAIGEDYVALQDDELFALRGGDRSARRTIASPFHPIGEVGAPQRLVTCGNHGDAIVLAMLTEAGAAVVITDPAGAVRHVIDLHEDDFSIDEDAERYSLGPLQGDLPRFVPYVAEPTTERAHLRVLDLEQGTIAWDGPDDLLMPMTTLFRAGDSWMLSLDGEVKRIDGTTGEPVAAAVASHDDGVTTVLPASIAGGRVWMTAPWKGPLDQLAIVALDARTLAPVLTRKIRVTDLTDEARAVLGRE